MARLNGSMTQLSLSSTNRSSKVKTHSRSAYSFSTNLQHDTSYSPKRPRRRNPGNPRGRRTPNRPALDPSRPSQRDRRPAERHRPASGRRHEFSTRDWRVWIRKDILSKSDSLNRARKEDGRHLGGPE